MKKITLTDVEISHFREFYQAELDKAKKRIATLTSILGKLGELKDKEEDEVNKLLESNKAAAKKVAKPAVKKTGKRGRPKKVKTETPVAEKKNEVKKVSKTKPKTAKAKSAKAIPEVEKLEDTKPAIAKKKAGRPAKKAQSIKAKVAKPAIAKTAKKKPARTKKAKTSRKPLKKSYGSKKVKWNDFVVDAISKSNKFLHSSDIVNEAITRFNVPEVNKDRVRMVIAGTLTKMATKDKQLSTFKKPKVRGSFYGLPQWVDEKGDIIPEMNEKVLA